MAGRLGRRDQQRPGVRDAAGRRLAATTYTYTATPTGTNPATVAGLVLRPRTVTTVNPGDDGLITDSVKPFTIPTKGGHAMVLAASDGTTWYADQ
jgi:hypothetical protein